MRITALLSVLIFISCGQKRDGVEYLLSWTNTGDIDTIYAEILDRQISDTLDLIKYKFDPRQDSWTAYEEVFNLPKRLDSVSMNDVTLVDQKTIEFENEKYVVSKYYYDMVDGADEESLYFYTSEFGIILFYWGTYRNSQRLIHTGDIQKDKIVYYLTARIENDCSFN
jgi:hypothetical protein